MQNDETQFCARVKMMERFRKKKSEPPVQNCCSRAKEGCVWYCTFPTIFAQLNFFSQLDSTPPDRNPPPPPLTQGSLDSLLGTNKKEGKKSNHCHECPLSALVPDQSWS